MIFRRKILLGGTPPSFNFDDVDCMFSLRKPEFTVEWTRAVLRLRRSSDNDLKYIFFDNNGKISLNSPIASSSLIPTATTLGTWVGSDDAFVTLWLAITPDNTVDGSKASGQGNSTRQPQFITSGVINTINGNPAVIFDGDDNLDTIAVSALDSGNDQTILTVSTNSISNGGVATIFTTNNDGGGGVDNARIVMFNVRSTDNRFINVVANDGGIVTPYVLTYINSQEDTGNQKLHTMAKNGFDINGYYNGVFQDSNTFTGTYLNNNASMGAQVGDVTFLTGSIQEIIIYPTDKTSNLNEINTNINDYYNIY